MALSAQILDDMKKTFPPGKVFFDFGPFPEYVKDATEEVHIPDALFFAEMEEDVVAAVRLCRRHHLPLVVRGAGTGYSGGALASSGGLLVSIEKMRAIRVDQKSRTAIVGPGAITGDIMKAAERVGLFYPPDPASYEESTIGGNLAENAGGLRCKKYGVTKDYVLGVRGVIAGGAIVSITDAAPFGLLHLLVGSEGTLFVFTEITLRLISRPVQGKAILATFADAVDAAAVVSEITAAGTIPAIMEFMDGDAIACSNQYDPEGRLEPCAALLLFETDGPRAEDEAGRIIEICRRYHTQSLRQATEASERDLLWKTRRNLSKAVKDSVQTKVAEDVCVPPSRLPELVAFVGELAGRYRLRVNCYGHAGDGNLHVNFLGMEGTEEERRETADGVDRLFKKTIALGGTLSGEHGIGLAKKEFMSLEFDRPTLSFMRRFKNALDPEGVLNPGKIFPAT